MLRFRLLGPFEAYRDDVRIPASDFRTTQGRCALKLLISEHDHPVPFSRLVDTFWGEADPAAARNSLQVAMRTVRRVLEPELARGTESRYIRTVGEAYCFVPNGASIDVDTFLGHRQAGLQAERRADSSVAIAAYRSAFAAYAGEYISEEPDAEWVLGRREQLREALLDLAERLAALLVAEDAHAEAVGVLERAVAADPLREELYARLMTLHARRGHRGHALATFERCRRITRSQIGVDPGAALVRLRDQIVSGEIVRSAAPAERRSTYTRAAPFVGREREVAVLREAWAGAAGVAGKVVVVGGDAGIGKTRLVEQLCERIAPDADQVWLRAHESSSGVEFAPILVTLGTWLDTATTRQVERLGAHAGVLATLLPGVRTAWPDHPRLDTAPQRAQLLEALTAGVFASSARPRAVIVVDDVHWSDPATFAWIAYACERARTGALFVLVARPGEGDATRVDRLRSDLRRRGRLVELEVAPLNAQNVERLVEDATEGSPHARGIAARLHAATRGNALFVVETIREIASRDGREELPIAASVRDAIVARIEPLPAAARDALGALAVAGGPADVRTLAEIAGATVDAVTDALDLLLSRRLVTVADDGRRYAIEHPLVERVAYDVMGPARRQEWHLRAAHTVTSASRGDAALRDTLRHLIAAGAPASEIVVAAQRVAASETAST